MTDLANQLSALGSQVRSEQDAWLGAEHSLGKVRAKLVGLERQRPSKLPSLGRGMLAAGGVGAVAAGVLLAVFLRKPPLAVTASAAPVAVGDWIRVRDQAVPLAFSDGTQIRLDPGSRARLEAVDAAGAHVTIESGHADVQVVPGRDGRWHLSLGPFGVDVTGTQFEIAWNPETEELALDMREGKVMVSGCVLGEGRPLLAGEHLTASCRERRFAVEHVKGPLAFVPSTETNAPTPSLAAPAATSRTEVAPAQDVIDADEPAVESTDTPSSAADAPSTQRADGPSIAGGAHSEQPSPDSWQALARAGKYKAALGAANGAGFENEVAHVSAEDLSLLGDVARFGGNVDAAVKAYAGLRKRFPRGPLAANAAFALGRIAFDQRGAYPEAERFFASYLAEQPRGPLAREALGRRMEALDRAGNRDAARSVARTYQQRYPSGPHIRLAEHLLAAP